MGALIPSGPLHPEDAVAALVVGLLVGLVGRFTVAGPFLAVGAAAATFEVRHGGLVDGLVDRPAPLWAALGVVVATVVTGALLVPLGARSVRLSGVVAGLPIAAVWGLVADTEAALIAGMVLLGAAAAGLGRHGRTVAVLAVLAPVAALVGSVGRPGQLTVALGAAVGWAIVARFGVDTWIRRRQRAGTPTTVEPGSTSSTTTAPAPTTAP